jgi:hypothetical protein
MVIATVASCFAGLWQKQRPYQRGWSFQFDAETTKSKEVQTRTARNSREHR